MGDEGMNIREVEKEIVSHINPCDLEAIKVVMDDGKEWFVVGPKCLELWWQFNGPKFPVFIDPYVEKILSQIKA